MFHLIYIIGQSSNILPGIIPSKRQLFTFGKVVSSYQNKIPRKNIRQNSFGTCFCPCFRWYWRAVWTIEFKSATRFCCSCVSSIPSRCASVTVTGLEFSVLNTVDTRREAFIHVNAVMVKSYLPVKRVRYSVQSASAKADLVILTSASVVQIEWNENSEAFFYQDILEHR